MRKVLVAICALAAALICLTNPLHSLAIAEFTDRCQLDSSGLTEVSVVAQLGAINIDEIGEHHIWLSSSEGDARDPILYDRRRDNLNFDGLYRLSLNGEHWFFRFNGQTFIEETGRTGLYNVEWAGAQSPHLGARYVLALMEDPPVDSAGPQFVTVGDSITWWNDGRYFRCTLLNHGLRATFLGSRIDTFGYRHDGEGNDTSADVIARLSFIPDSENYLLMIGTNDLSKKIDTVNNINTIASTLAARGPRATVLVSTLLPRFDEFASAAIDVNAKLREVPLICPEQCKLVDIAAEVERLPEWRSVLLPDGIHPTRGGYEAIAPIVVDILEGHIRTAN